MASLFHEIKCRASNSPNEVKWRRGQSAYHQTLPSTRGASRSRSPTFAGSGSRSPTHGLAMIESRNLRVNTCTHTGMRRPTVPTGKWKSFRWYNTLQTGWSLPSCLIELSHWIGGASESRAGFSWAETHLLETVLHFLAIISKISTRVQVQEERFVFAFFEFTHVC